MSMKNLVEALQIFLKYGNPSFPTHCEHYVLWICGIEWEDISEEDQNRLDELGFFYCDSEGSIQSFRYGSA